MRYLLLLGWMLFLGLTVMAQPKTDTSWKKNYRETATRINNLEHTKLDVRPDFSK